VRAPPLVTTSGTRRYRLSAAAVATLALLIGLAAGAAGPAAAAPVTTPALGSPAHPPVGRGRGASIASRVVLVAGTRSVREYRPATVRVAVRPARAGRVVAVEMRAGRRWLDLGRRVTGTSGDATFRLRFSAVGGVRLRAVVEAGDGFRAAASPVVAVSVT